MVMCHMVADTTDELLSMADRITLHRKWLQHGGSAEEHFDVSMGYRARAVANGAVEVSSRDIVQIIRRKRAGPHFS